MIFHQTSIVPLKKNVGKYWLHSVSIFGFPNLPIKNPLVAAGLPNVAPRPCRCPWCPWCPIPATNVVWDSGPAAGSTGSSSG